MKEQELLTHHLQLTALTVESRIQRILDALHELKRITVALFSESCPTAERLQEWLRDSHYASDANGFFADQDTLARIRAGEHLPEAFSVSWSAELSACQGIQRRLFALRNFGSYLHQLSQRLPGCAWIYYQDAENASLQYPFIDACEAIPADFDWLMYHTMRSVAPENNPERSIRWTTPTIDYAGEGLILSASIPVYHGDTWLGCWSIDLPLRSIEEEIVSGHVLDGQESFLVDADGLLLLHERVRGQIDLEVGSIHRESLGVLGGGFEHFELQQPELSKGLSLELSDGQGRELLLCAKRIPAMDWTLFTSIPRSVLDETMRRRLADALHDVKRGRLGRRITQQELGAEWNDVTQAFNEMTAALEEALVDARRASERYQTLAENSLDLIWLMDEGGQFTYVNPAVEGMLGFTASEWIAKRWQEHADTSARQWMNYLLNSRGDTECSGALRGITALKHREGHWVQVETVCRVMRDERGNTRRVLGIGRDISERLRNEQELTRLEAQLRQSQKMEAVGQLAGGVAHDFNNILQAMQGYGVLVKDSLEVGSEEHGFMCELLRSVERAAALTKQLLAFGRRQTLSPEHIDLRNIVSEAVRMIHRVLGEDILLDLKQDDQALVIHADRGQLEQVLVNLCLNARDAMPGGGRLQIQTSKESFSEAFCAQHPWAVVGEHVCLRVSDTGCGMTDKVLGQIFEPFFTTKEIGRGTGLGLAMVYGIVRQHNGFVHVDSTQGRGSVFSVYLPLSGGKVQQFQPPPASAHRGKGERLLVVEDERTVRKLMLMALRSAGFKVESAVNGDEALRLLQEGHCYDLLLTDVVMPGISGHELARAFLERCEKGRVLFMSGFSPRLSAEDLLQQPHCSFLQKPFAVPRLLSALHALLYPQREEQGIL